MNIITYDKCPVCNAKMMRKPVFNYYKYPVNLANWYFVQCSRARCVSLEGILSKWKFWKKEIQLWRGYFLVDDMIFYISTSIFGLEFNCRPMDLKQSYHQFHHPKSIYSWERNSLPMTNKHTLDDWYKEAKLLHDSALFR